MVSKARYRVADGVACLARSVLRGVIPASLMRRRPCLPPAGVKYVGRGVLHRRMVTQLGKSSLSQRRSGSDPGYR